MPKGRISAYHPYQEGATIDPSGDILLDFPATQHYTIAMGSAHPDPKANFLAGRSSSNEVKFYTVASLLKLRYVGEMGDVLSKIVFEAPGKKLNGCFSLGWDGNSPTMEFSSGGSDKIELLLGDEGVTMDGSLHNFYIVVPPGIYNEGFKLHIHTSDGRITTKTASGRVEIERGKLYPMGEVAEESVGQYELQENVSWISEDRAQYIIDAVPGTSAVGGSVYAERIPCLTLTVTDKFKPVMDEIILFQPNALFPDGYYGQVTKINASNPKRIIVETVPPGELGYVFEELQLGSVTFDNEGNPNEEDCLDIDLASYLMRIETADGGSVPFSTKGSDISIQLPSNLLDYAPTKATSFKKEFDTGTLSFSHDIDENAHINIAAGMKIALKMAASITEGSIDYIHLGLTPQLSFSIGADIVKEVKWGKDQYLFTAVFAPIPVPPVVVTPVIDVYAIAGLGGEVKAQVNVSVTASGNVGFSYINPSGGEAGFVARANNFNAGANVSAELSGSVYAFGGLRTDMGLSLCKIVSTYLSVDSKAVLQATVSTEASNNKLALFSQVEAKGALASLLWSRLETDPVKWESAPLWEAKIYPDFGSPTMSLVKTESFGDPADENYYVIDYINITLPVSGNLFCDYETSIRLQTNADDEMGREDIIMPGYNPYHTVETWTKDINNQQLVYTTADTGKEFVVQYKIISYPNVPGQNAIEQFRQWRHRIAVDRWHSEVFYGRDLLQ